MPELGPCLGEHLPHLGIECIETLRPIHAHDQDPAMAFCFDDSHTQLLSNFGATGQHRRD